MRPTPLTVICIIGLCLAVMGAFTILSSCGGLAMQPLMDDLMSSFQRSMPPNPQMQQQMDAQMAMQREMMAAQRPWIIPGLILQLVSVTLLFIGCIRGLALKPRAHRWLLAALIVGIFQSVAQIGLTWGMQEQMMAITSRHMPNLMRPPPGTPMPPGMNQFMSAWMNFVMSISILFVALWGLAKIGYFAWSIWYVSTPGVRRLFIGDGGSAGEAHQTPAPSAAAGLQSPGDPAPS